GARKASRGIGGRPVSRAGDPTGSQGARPPCGCRPPEASPVDASADHGSTRLDTGPARVGGLLAGALGCRWGPAASPHTRPRCGAVVASTRRTRAGGREGQGFAAGGEPRRRSRVGTVTDRNTDESAAGPAGAARPADLNLLRTFLAVYRSGS